MQLPPAVQAALNQQMAQQQLSIIGLAGDQMLTLVATLLLSGSRIISMEEAVEQALLLTAECNCAVTTGKLGNYIKARAQEEKERQSQTPEGVSS